MFGRRRQSRGAERRLREFKEVERISEIRWQWRNACSNTPLAPAVYTPSGTARAVPVIGSVKLEPMVSFTVRVRPGQTVADFTAAAPSLAAAMNAARLKVEPISPHWVRIVLLPKNVVPFPARSDDEAA
jgi:hypothetical protein